MRLKELIHSDYVKAFKERNTIEKSLLSYVKGNIDTTEKIKNGSPDLNDEEVISVINKLVNFLKDALDKNPKDEKTKLEIDILNRYLPELISEEEITERIKFLSDSGVNKMGDFMKGFAGVPVDKSLVNKIVKEFLSNEI